MSDNTVTKFGGKTDRIAKDLEPGDRLIIVAEATVSKLELDGETTTRILKLVDVHELDGDLGRNLVSSLRNARRHAEDAAAGRDVLPGLESTVDVAGVVATATERIAIRDDDGFGEPAADETEPEAPARGSDLPLIDVGAFVDTLGKPITKATATELKAGLERHTAIVGPDAMVEVATGVERFERARKGGPRSRVLAALDLYLGLPTPPPAAQAGIVGELEEDGEVDLGDEVSLEADMQTDDFPDPTDAEDDDFDGIDLELEAP